MPKHLFVYAAAIVGSLVIALDFASVDLALPALERQFSLNFQSVQWVINGYVLAFAVLMVSGGRLADAYGRKKIFLIGMGVFAAASLLGGCAWSGGSVIAFRVLQGVGAAMLWPAMIGMVCAAVGDENRAMALGLIFGTCSVGNAAGPVVGGALTEWFSWRWVLWVNVPMALFSMFIALWRVPQEEVSAAKPANDYQGMLSLTGGLVALMLAVYQVQSWGWSDSRTLALCLASLLLLGAFPFIERKATQALIPPDIMRNREILTLCLCTVVICQLFFVVLLYFTQYAMKFMGEDPIAAGARVVQFMLVYGVVSYFGGPLGKLFGTRRLLVLGLVSAAVASFWLSIIGPGASWLSFNAALMLLGVGVGAVIPTVSARAIETVGTERAGLVSGITFMCQLSGSALMLAVNTAIFTAVANPALDRPLMLQNVVLSSAQRESVAALLNGAETLSSLPQGLEESIPQLAGLAASAYQSGLQVILWLSAALDFATFLLVLRFVPAQKKS